MGKSENQPIRARFSGPWRIVVSVPSRIVAIAFRALADLPPLRIEHAPACKIPGRKNPLPTIGNGLFSGEAD